MRGTTVGAAAIITGATVIGSPGMAYASPTPSPQKSHSTTVAGKGKGGLAIHPTATPPCNAGDFCVWWLRYGGGSRFAWVGLDSDWTNNHFPNGAVVNDNDMSWRDNGYPTSDGVNPDHVKVYRDIHYAGGVTICLLPGQYVGADTGAENRGSSHGWYMSC